MGWHGEGVFQADHTGPDAAFGEQAVLDYASVDALSVVADVG
jgi:hypothetical protein